jgi:gas vesicle protein
MDKQNKGIIIGASVGALAGVIAGILLAPQSGKETRADIAKYIHEMKDKIAEELAKAGEVTKESYNEIVEKIVKVYELDKKITVEDAQDIKEKLNDNYDQVVKTVKE